LINEYCPWLKFSLIMIKNLDFNDGKKIMEISNIGT
jgi:hypothetical protein